MLYFHQGLVQLAGREGSVEKVRIHLNFGKEERDEERGADASAKNQGIGQRLGRERKRLKEQQNIRQESSDRK